MNGRPRRANTVGVDPRMFIDQRLAGLTTREIADHHGLTEGQVVHLIRAEGLYGEWAQATKDRAAMRPGRNRKVKTDLNKLLLIAFVEHDEVTIERGMNRGYIVTIDDVPGCECRSITQAIESAVKAGSS